MRAAAKTRRVGATAAILTWSWLAAATSAGAQATDAPADAQTTAAAPDAGPGRDVINGQMQMGDVFAAQTLSVVEAQQTVNQATAAGNTASAVSTGAGVSFTSKQSATGAVEANAVTTVERSSGDYAGVTSSATGNAGTAGACCGRLSGVVTQETGDKAVTAKADLAVGEADQISADAAAVGNTQGWISQYGSVGQATTQTLSGPVRAQTDVAAGEVYGLAGSSATAVGNDVSVDASQGSAAEGYTTQTVTGGDVRAVLTSQQQAGDEIAGQATATANNVTVYGEGDYVTHEHAQTNAAAVTADAAYGLGTWNSASVGAYGVGNSVLVSSGSALTESGVTQANTGEVAARASLLTGGSGGDAYVSATAVGNAVQGFACSTCDGGVGARSSQSNAGAVRATSVYRGTYGGAVTGTASAVGNTATYVFKSSGS